MYKKAATGTVPSASAAEFSSVTKSFDQIRKAGLLRREKHLLTALDDVSFTIQRGEFVAYAGPNGAGKSTTFKLLCGMLAPKSGDIQVLGRNPLTDRIPLMREVGVLFGNRSELWWDHPVRTSFEWKKQVWAIPDDVYQRMFTTVRRLLGIDDFLDTFARELSLGQRMRANLGMMLLHDPSLILLDEPTLGLDVLAKRQMIDFLKYINREEGSTILVTSHDMDDLTEMAQRIMLIHKGKIAFDGSYPALMQATGDKHILSFRASGTLPDLPCATFVDKEEDLYRFEYDANPETMASLLKALSAIEGISDVETGRAPIEAVIAELYQSWIA